MFTAFFWESSLTEIPRYTLQRQIIGNQSNKGEISISIKKKIGKGYKDERWTKSRKYWIGERNPNWIVRRRENESGELIQIARENEKFDMLLQLELKRYSKVWFLKLTFSDGKELKQ